VVKFSGALKDSGGKPLSGVVGVTFSVYKDPEGGAALWMETQNVQLDDQGRYTVPLRATKNEGIPADSPRRFARSSRVQNGSARK
jgi:hypothetical protein